MNKIINPYLRDFILVFFYDILIYSKTWVAHVHHVDKALQLLQDHHFFTKHSKCSFGISVVEYLGHIVGQDGVWVDPKKIITMQEWPHPKNLKSLSGFLGLIIYYWKFVKCYGKIVAPLISLVKKNAISLNEATKQPLVVLNQDMHHTLTLVMLDFTKTFALECDALGTSLGVILMQDGCPLAFISKHLCDRNLG